MEIVLVGLNHKTAPVETRERFAVLEGHVPATLQGLLDGGTIHECCVLSTCNRTEIYAVGENGGEAADQVVRVLSARQGVGRDSLLPYLYHRFNEDATRHLFSVAAGLDSMILGEGQILSQVREAHRLAMASQGVGPVMGRLFERAIKVGKRVRTETHIAQGASSVSAAAVELARRIHGSLAKKSVLVIGTGKMGMLTVKLLINAGTPRITILSRTLERAQKACAQFAAEAEATAATMETLADQLVENDVVVSCTGAPVPVISRAAVAAILRRRRYRPLFIVDIAVPRDVEAEVNELDGVYLYNVDDLAGVVSSSMADRQGELEASRAIVEDEVEGFARFLSSLETVPAIRRLREAFEAMRTREVDALKDLSEDERKRVDAISRGLVNRLLHAPTVRLKELAATRNIHDGIRFLLEVFEGDAPPAAAAPPEATPAEEQREATAS